jgi:hypothetical protein
MRLNALNSLLTKWTFRSFLLKNAYTRGEIEALVAQTNFKQCDIQTSTIGMDIWLKK